MMQGQPDRLLQERSLDRLEVFAADLCTNSDLLFAGVILRPRGLCRAIRRQS